MSDNLRPAEDRSAYLSLSGRIVILIVLVVLVVTACGGGENQAPPVTNQGKRWRIAYYEGGTFFDYSIHLRVLVDGLVELGWMEQISIPKFSNPEDTRPIWNFLAEQTRSDYVEFVPDAYWSADWDESVRQANKEEAIRRLSRGDDIDLVIAMGTWAGLDLANNFHSVPTIVVSASDPVRAGIIKSVEDSGFDHVHAQCDPRQYIRQVRFFHDIVGFKRLGVAYEDTADGRTYANLDAFPNTIAINLETARMIGFDPPEGILEAADQIYEQILTERE